jgi:DNA-binding transcriptional LysR family regulator
VVELRQLRYFVAVAEEGHFGRAAARLHISTPTLSQQIRVVERTVGASLLVRRGRGVELTAAGQVLLREGRQALRVVEEAVRAARQAAGVADPVLRLGLLNGVPDWLPRRVEEILVATVPDCLLVLVGGTTAAQLRLVERGEVDLALVRLPVTVDPGRRVARIAEEELGVLMSAAHPLATRNQIDPADLTGRELILFARDLAPGYHDAVMRTLRSLGAQVVLSDSVIGAAQWRSALPLRPDALSLSSVRAADTPSVVWRPVRGRPLTVAYGAVWRPDSRNPALQAVVGELSRQPLQTG